MTAYIFTSNHLHLFFFLLPICYVTFALLVTYICYHSVMSNSQVLLSTPMVPFCLCFASLLLQTLTHATVDVLADISQIPPCNEDMATLCCHLTQFWMPETPKHQCTATTQMHTDQAHVHSDTTPVDSNQTHVHSSNSTLKNKHHCTWAKLLHTKYNFTHFLTIINNGTKCSRSAH